MFEKFTVRARKVVSLARQEAQRLNSEYIGTEHILLGIIQEGGGVAAKVLKSLNVDLKRIRQEIEKLITPSTSPAVTLGQLPFSPRAGHVIELSGAAAAELRTDVIGTEHMLLGLMQESEGIGAQVLLRLGLKLGEVREMVREVLAGDAQDDVPQVPAPGESPLPIMPRTPTRLSLRATHVMRRASLEARRLHSNAVKPPHLLLALIRERPAVLRALGFKPRAMARMIENEPKPGTPSLFDHPPLSRHARTALSVAGVIAVELGDKRITTDAILLALLNQAHPFKDDVVGRLLGSVDRERMKAVLQEQRKR